MALSIEVLFHLVEDEVYETYLNDLFRLGVDYVVIMRSNCHEDIRLKCVLESVWKDRYSDEIRRLGAHGFPAASEAPGSFCFSDFYFFKQVRH